jgi:uncharacterized lipoprotein YddW (UPF0748 family)
MHSAARSAHGIPGLSVERQQMELRAILDRAADLGLNAVLLQVRPAGDALYASPYEPWSEYLTGAMGRAPDPFYDPLEFAVEEAHRRGLELHAWFNPFRARHPSAKSPASADHISRARPGLVHRYGAQLWMDPSDWRRENVNRFVERLYAEIKRQDPRVKFGVSPFGIWRPGHPAQIRGLDAYEEIFADARKWLSHGWLDYCTPQLYWPID